MSESSNVRIASSASEVPMGVQMKRKLDAKPVEYVPSVPSIRGVVATTGAGSKKRRIPVTLAAVASSGPRIKVATPLVADDSKSHQQGQMPLQRQQRQLPQSSPSALPPALLSVADTTTTPAGPAQALTGTPTAAAVVAATLADTGHWAAGKAKDDPVWKRQGVEKGVRKSSLPRERVWVEDNEKGTVSTNGFFQKGKRTRRPRNDLVWTNKATTATASASANANGGAASSTKDKASSSPAVVVDTAGSTSLTPGGAVNVSVKQVAAAAPTVSPPTVSVSKPVAVLVDGTRQADVAALDALANGVAEQGVRAIGKTFSKDSDSKRAAVDSRGNERNLQCDQCGKLFSMPSQLKYHRRYHTGERPYACTLCEKRFFDPSHVKSHMRVHTGEKPFKCVWPDCDARFAEKRSLTLHTRIHTGEKNYTCDVCGRAFRHLNTRKKHRVKIHPNVPLPASDNQLPSDQPQAQQVHAHPQATATSASAGATADINIASR